MCSILVEVLRQRIRCIRDWVWMGSLLVWNDRDARESRGGGGRGSLEQPVSPASVETSRPGSLDQRRSGAGFGWDHDLFGTTVMRVSRGEVAAEAALSSP